MWWNRHIKHCPHMIIRGIYGDEINHRCGYRLQCMRCGTLLDGPVSYATVKPQLDN